MLERVWLSVDVFTMTAHGHGPLPAVGWTKPGGLRGRHRGRGADRAGVHTSGDGRR
ncbi:hypothetical protein QJS66_23280 (plasmid) [Kocuria rhizophila]|nr:hypothetical protein QJS66_23280 [Kocuria rhizophila]